VIHDVPDRMVVVGNPAQVVCSIDELTCQVGKIEGPYVDGLDVMTREAMGIPVAVCGSTG